MLKKKNVYKCDVCGNIVEGLWNGKPSISCCGQPMRELVPNTTDAAVEKHVPVIIRDGKKVTVKVGEAAHPMTPEHYILFVELISGNTLMRHDFVEGDTIAAIGKGFEGAETIDVTGKKIFPGAIDGHVRDRVTRTRCSSPRKTSTPPAVCSAVTSRSSSPTARASRRRERPSWRS